MEAAIRSIASPVDAGATSERRVFAPKLGSGGAGSVSLAAWSGANVKPDARAERLDALLAELANRFPSSLEAGALVGRATSIGTEPSQDRRLLLTDSLIREVVDACARRLRQRGP